MMTMSSAVVLDFTMKKDLAILFRSQGVTLDGRLGRIRILAVEGWAEAC